MHKVELIYERGCPKIEGARENLLRAFARLGLPPRWTEWDRTASDTPTYARKYGSPSVLIDEKDCLGARPESSLSSCRIYEGPEGTLIGIPSIEAIASALTLSSAATVSTQGSADRKTKWFSNAAILPGIGVALLPKLACPACWPAYAGILSAVGLGFLVESRYLLIMTTIFLAVALGALAFRAGTRRGYGPFGLGLAAAAAIMLGKFSLESEPIMYAGVGLLVGTSFWNSWPRGAVKSGSCPSCVETEPVPK